MTKRNNFEFTKEGKILCNFFYEKNSSKTSSTDLPFYESADYYVCADSINEGNSEISYDTDGKKLQCHEIVEGELTDYRTA